MLELYTWNTPNGYKVPILLEELGLSYTLHPVDIHKGDQNTEQFSKLNPNNKIPILVDSETGVVLSESGAILIYLAEKYGSFLSTDIVVRAAELQWLMFQKAGVGPMFGQANHFLHYAPEKVEYGINRYSKEANRIMSVLNTRLAGAKFLGGDEYSIADIATWPWVRKGMLGGFVDITEYPYVDRWFGEIEKRPAVLKALEKTDGLAEHA